MLHSKIILGNNEFRKEEWRMWVGYYTYKELEYALYMT
jgi:hypothetical protein